MRFPAPSTRIPPAHCRSSQTRVAPAVKRALDVVLASAILLLTAPLIALAALAVVVDSPGPPLYRSLRVGRNGRHFWMYKLRKMHVDAGGPPLTVANDERLTRVGRVISRLKIDELPQLLNVIKGDMSLVGPRPQSPEFVAQHADDYAVILRVRPGITGPSQVAFAEEDRVLCHERPLLQYLQRILPQKLALDQMYVSDWSLRSDLRILFWTFVTVVLRVPVAVHRRDGRMSVRRRKRREPAAPPTENLAEKAEPAPAYQNAA